MYNSKLIQLLLSLDKQEKTQLKKWVKSPMHNSHREVTKLFLYLLSRRKLTIKNTEKAKVFAHIIPHKPYNDLRLRHVMSLAVQVLENFVCFLMQQKNTKLQQLNLLRFYNSKNLHKFCDQILYKTAQEFEQETIKDQAYYQYLYQLNKEFYPKVIESNKKTAQFVQKLEETLDNFAITFVIETLQNACQVLNAQELVTNTSLNIPFLPVILEAIDNKQYDNVILIQCYYNAYMLLSQEDKQHYYEQLKKDLFAYYQNFSVENLRTLYILTLNYSIKDYNTTSGLAKEDLFEVYKFGLEHSIIIEHNLLRVTSYKNIVTLAMYLKKITWLEVFIEVYTPRLEKSYQKNYGTYAQALLLYAQEAYQESLALLKQIESNDIYLVLLVKTAHIKIYYILGAMDTLDAFLDNFYVYLKRHEVPGYQYEYYINHIILMRRLIKIAPYDRKAWIQLRERTHKLPMVVNKVWILELIDQYLV